MKTKASPDTKAARSTTSCTVSDDNTIARCNMRNCAVTSSWVKRCTLQDCVLSHVRSGRWITAYKTHFHGVYAVKRSDFHESVVCGGSSVRRCTVKSSTVRDDSSMKQSTLTGTTVSHSQLWRATLSDCDVEDCVITRSDLTGMVLKYGVWKKGRLVGRVGDKEPIAVRKDGTVVNMGDVLPATTVPVAPELDVMSRIPVDRNAPRYVDSDASLDSEESSGEDLPPPYKV
ncbi:uncharacterized protein N7459_002331 [Penicillium hispanicum]|uniref:uncharacterized protein n=1 Tax=Penicillium hispanicum TaxID=1080232 RepID=UPI00253F6EDE|nr:uncharacterized protein N7459_002331 [Penicillium hispanicum]KAJ5591962.1 hypothetical protein N7459_002331 [Penicillium hispanicum]